MTGPRPGGRSLRTDRLVPYMQAVYALLADGGAYTLTELVTAGQPYVPVHQAARFGAARDVRRGKVRDDPGGQQVLVRAARAIVASAVRGAARGSNARLARTDDGRYRLAAGPSTGAGAVPVVAEGMTGAVGRGAGQDVDRAGQDVDRAGQGREGTGGTGPSRPVSLDVVELPDLAAVRRVNRDLSVEVVLLREENARLRGLLDAVRGIVGPEG